MKATRKVFNYAKRVIAVDGNVVGAENFIDNKQLFVSFDGSHSCILKNENGKHASVLIDFGREMSGGVRIITNYCRDASKTARVRLVFGESVSEAMSELFGKQNATNDHSPRDFEATLAFMSTLEYGRTGFRFLKLELLGDNAEISIKNIIGVCELPGEERRGYIKTNDERLNSILETAFYTCQLNMQDGYILDGIKRDRLVWCGDLFSEILTVLYTYGDAEHIPNALGFLKSTTPEGKWINTMPSYNAWWILNICTYCKFTGKSELFNENLDYVKELTDKYDACISDSGEIRFSENGGGFFLDWPTKDTPDEVPGTALLILYTFDCLKAFTDNEYLIEKCEGIRKKLEKYMYAETNAKQVIAFQVLCGNRDEKLKEKLEKGGAEGVSTFMSYFILKALDLLGSQKALDIAKEYYGAMLDRGATSFWEDFSMDWLNGSGRIDEIPKVGEKDLHGDYGAFCYKGFRHSLCHGWSSGVYPFILEKLLGFEMKENAFKRIALRPADGEIRVLEAKIPTPCGDIEVFGDRVKLPVGIKAE